MPQLARSAHAVTQSNDALRDHDESELTSFEVMMLDSMEDKHASATRSGVTHALQNVSTDRVLASARPLQVSHDLILNVECCVHTSETQAAQSPTQSSEALYNQAGSRFTSFKALFGNSTEDIHTPVSVSCMEYYLIPNCACVHSELLDWRVCNPRFDYVFLPCHHPDIV